MHLVVKLILIVATCYGALLVLYFSHQIGRTAPAIKSKDFEHVEYFTKYPREAQSETFFTNKEKIVQELDQQTLTKKKDLLVLSELRRSFNPFYLLGAYPPINPSYQIFKYNQTFRGLVQENDYCERTDLYNLANPESMLTRKHFYTDFPKEQLPRGLVMEKIGVMAMENYDLKSTVNKKKHFLNTTINAYFMESGMFHIHFKMGTNFLCATQMYNHIPGIKALTEKDKVVDKINLYLAKYKERPQCFNKTSLFLPTYRLYIQEECRSFFNLINSKEYKESLKTDAIQYVVKVGFGVHKSQGVFLLDANQNKILNTDYDYGARCGREDKSLIAQTYVNNPLLLDMDNKFDFRVYMLIASTNPFIVYYHDGFLKVSLYPYSKTSTDRATHLTNTYLANQRIAEAKSKNITINNMTEKELKEYILWGFERFQQYLLESGKITDPNWLDNYLRPAFHRAMIHIIRTTGDAFWKQSNVFALHGVDFMLDDNMKLWFIESNPSPLLTGTTKYKVYLDVLTSMFEIQFAYYRSRMARVLRVINEMQQEMQENDVVDLQKWREEYQNAVKNRLEPEYKISPKNTFTLVMDEGLPGTKAYANYLDLECI